MKCFDIKCEMPATGTGAGFLVCVHEHMTRQAEFCMACWTHRRWARWTWNCEFCYGRKPRGGREEWGHLCPMRIVVPD